MEKSGEKPVNKYLLGIQVWDGNNRLVISINCCKDTK
jgi:hypothetical protein